MEINYQIFQRNNWVNFNKKVSAIKFFLQIQRALRPSTFFSEIQKLEVFEKTNQFFQWITRFQLSVGYVIFLQYVHKINKQLLSTANVTGFNTDYFITNSTLSSIYHGCVT